MKIRIFAHEVEMRAGSSKGYFSGSVEGWSVEAIDAGARGWSFSIWLGFHSYSCLGTTLAFAIAGVEDDIRRHRAQLESFTRPVGA